MFSLTNCNHKFCKKCLKKLITKNLPEESKILNYVCPFYDCSEPIMGMEVKKILGN